MSVYDDLDEEKLEHVLERCRRDFTRTSDPLHAWEAWGVISLSRRSRLHATLDVPPWLSAYFDSCARSLVASPPSPASRDAIGRALGFRDGLAKARKRWGGQYDERERLAERVFDLMWERGISLEGVLKHHTKAMGASRSSVRRAARGASRWALAKVQERVRTATGALPERERLFAA